MLIMEKEGVVNQDKEFNKKVQELQDKIQKIKDEVAKIVIGQHKVIDSMIECLLADGHVLVEGIPGIGKTLLVRCFSKNQIY